jgi:glycosyltransferase involved in cell wall biosynthesis
MYAAMDLLVLPSFREGLPNVLLEAASMGLPMIASNISGCSDVIQHGVSGYLFPAGNHLALANLIEAFLENPADSLAMTLKAQQFVHESFSQTEMREALYDLYQARLAALK